MTSDIYPHIDVDVVIFTIVDNENLLGPSQVGLVSPLDPHAYAGRGLSLFVVTMQGEKSRMLPGGQIEADETIEQAAQRIAEEKLGISIKTRLRALSPFDKPNRQPNHRSISFPYWAMVNFEDIKFYLGGKDRVGLELVNSQWFMDETNKREPIDFFDGVSRFGNRRMPNPTKRIGHDKTLTQDMPGGRILELDHDDMVFFAWRQLRHAFNSKLDPFNYLGINPLGNEFRMSDLLEFHEVCLGYRKDPDTFKRHMSKEAFLLESLNVDKKRPGKPASLYRLSAPPN